MINGPKYKICKRVGNSVFPQCQTPKFAASAARTAANKNKKRGRQRSEYGTQLLEKQKVKFSYGISERQFSKYVILAQKNKKMNASNFLYQLLETRLDNFVYKLGFVNSRAFGRQAVVHGHFTVNGKKVSIPSINVSVGDKISVRKGSLENAIFRGLKDKLKNFKVPKWTKFDPETLTAEIVSQPVYENEEGMNLNTVMEFYSRT